MHLETIFSRANWRPCDPISCHGKFSEQKSVRAFCMQLQKSVRRATREVGAATVLVLSG